MIAELPRPAGLAGWLHYTILYQKRRWMAVDDAASEEGGWSKEHQEEDE